MSSSNSFTNDFSWSGNRASMFRECLRKYYLNYYGYWNGWDSSSSEKKQLIYRLKKLQNRYMWLGNVVHEAVEKTLQFVRKNHPPEPDTVVQDTVDTLRSQFQASRSGKYHQDPKRYPGLTEHEYEEDLPDSEWQKIRDRGITCLNNFFESEAYRNLRDNPPDRWLAIEGDLSRNGSGPDHCDIAGTQVFLKLDLAFARGDTVHLLDWKTGTGSGDLSQLICYGYYAWKEWDVEPEDMKLTFYNLLKGEYRTEDITHSDLESMEDVIREDVLEMKELLVDPDSNTAREEDFPKTDNLSLCRRCRFRGVCYPDGVPDEG